MNVKFKGMGFFTTSRKWCHPKKIEKTTDLIYVMSGDVCIFEEENKFRLKKGDLLILKPHILHGGFEESFGKTSFYWLHIQGTLPEDFYGVVKNFSGAWLFRELIDYANIPQKNERALQIVTEHILLNVEMAKKYEKRNKLTKEVFEWVRVNISSKLTVEKTAEYFGYTREHISKIIKKEYGVSLKRLIDRLLVDKIKDYLVNTTYSIKEISAMTEFNESTAFINFFKYHERITPSDYRNKHTEIHMNNV